MTSSYCRATFNWDTNNSTQQNVTRYSFIDVESSDFHNISYENRINNKDDSSLQFFKQDHDDNFLMTIVCNSPELSQINGISIESESKTLEISNDVQGYIKTVRGKKGIQDSNAEDSSHNTESFVCSTCFDRSYSSLSIKFLSLGKKESISIKSIVINLQQHCLDSSSTKMKGTFDIAKLKKEVEGMGDRVSDKALDFLATLEIYEQNKINSFSNTFEQNATMMTVQPQSGLGPGILSLMKSVLGDENMKNIEGTVPSNNEEFGGQKGIYGLLQSVCGKVAKTRKTSQSTEETLSVKTAADELQSRTTNDETKDSAVVLEIFNRRLEEAKQDTTQEINKVKQEVMNEIEGMKKEFTGKLDAITSLLQQLANSQNSHCVEDE